MKHYLAAFVLALAVPASVAICDPASAQAGPMKWEYGMLYYSVHQIMQENNGTDPFSWHAGKVFLRAQSIEDLRRQLEAKGEASNNPDIWNGLGEKGWELVSVADEPQGAVLTHFFKRPRP